MVDGVVQFGHICRSHVANKCNENVDVLDEWMNVACFSYLLYGWAKWEDKTALTSVQTRSVIKSKIWIIRFEIWVLNGHLLDRSCVNIEPHLNTHTYTVYVYNFEKNVFTWVMKSNEAAWMSMPSD